MAYRNMRDKPALVLFAIPILALLIWYFYSSHGPARLLLSCYVLVATPFFLLVGSYPPFGTRWFWKSDDIDSSARWCLRVRSSSDNRLVPIYRYIDITLPSRVSFGFTAIIACFEGWAAWRIVDATEPKTTGQILS